MCAGVRQLTWINAFTQRQRSSKVLGAHPFLYSSLVYLGFVRPVCFRGVPIL